VSLPAKEEPLQIGDISQLNLSPQVQKALKRLQADKAPSTLSQLVMWRLAAGLDWNSISQLSSKWANASELTLARHFVDHLDTLPAGETGRVLFQIQGSGSSNEAVAAQVAKEIQGKTILGLVAQVQEIPARPDGPALACRIRFNDDDALVQITGSDPLASKWAPFGKFSLALVKTEGKLDTARFGDDLAVGILTRLVRARLIKGPDSTTRVKGKLIYQLQIENFSPLILNGLAILGTEPKAGETPNLLWMISLSPRRSMTLPANEETVRGLGLKKGTRVVALDLSGL
jgi:hypothetical protein